MTCCQCKKCGECGKPYSSNSTYAEICKDFEKKKMTNYEKIKQMSIEEMSNFLMDWVTETLTNPKCFVVKHWLESEVEE